VVIKKGTFVIDMYDAGAKQLVWTGRAEKILEPDRSQEDTQKLIAKGAKKIAFTNTKALDRNPRLCSSFLPLQRRQNLGGSTKRLFQMQHHFQNGFRFGDLPLRMELEELGRGSLCDD
jgi:hypothetical protein